MHKNTASSTTRQQKYETRFEKEVESIKRPVSEYQHQESSFFIDKKPYNDTTFAVRSGLNRQEIQTSLQTKFAHPDVKIKQRKPVKLERVPCSSIVE